MATTAQWLGARERRKRHGKSGELTKRKKEILYCRCVKGMTNNETGHELCITGQTVKNHVTDLMEQMGVRTMYEACFRFGKQLGKVEAEKAGDADR